ncbi:MAG: amidotransferase [Planctomycetes bacterium]|jgi:GMP synthase-like glutamine amidotransferase|nr:amidotransferase [Planctomycetota bacterium]
MRLCYIQHVPFEDPGGILQWAAERGHAVHGAHMHAEQPLPEPAPFDGLVVMGGPMSIHDEASYPWLAAEKRAIGTALDAGRKVLGVCLGAQLLAHVLGSNVGPQAHREIGWFDVAMTEAGRAHPWTSALPSRFAAFHWHGEAFDVPEGAVHLARSQACEAQAFAWSDRALGLQFHLESTPDTVAELVRHGAHELDGGPWVQSADHILDGHGHIARMYPMMSELLDRFFGV